MKSAIMIAYWFPPEGNAAAYRPLRFVRHLENSGWAATVISLEPHRYERHDPELLSFVPGGVKIVRVRSRDPWQALQARRSKRARTQNGPALPPIQGGERSSLGATLRSGLRKIVNAAEPWIYHPDPTAGWIGPAVRASVELCRRRTYDAIWATGMPWSSFIAAEKIYRRTGVPFVLDFRSSWTLVPNGFEARRPAWARRRDRAVLRRLFEQARSVIFAYHAEAECYWRAYPGALTPSKIHVIPNGFEGEVEGFAPAESERCTIVYAGTLSSYRYDTLLEALEQFQREDPAGAGRLRFVFVGEDNRPLRAEAERRGLSGIVEALPPTTYAEVCRMQRQAHALLMLERAPAQKGYELLAGAKLFGYLKAGRPILGVLPQGEAKKILARVGASTVADVNSTAEIRSALRRLLDAWCRGSLASLVPERAGCELFSAERQTAALACALDGSAAAEPFIPGQVDIPPSLKDEVARERRLQANERRGLARIIHRRREPRVVS